jgi:hypothetical protein
MTAKPKRVVDLAIEEARAALTVLKGALAEHMHVDDRKVFDRPLNKARAALDKASMEISDISQDMQNAVDRL